MLFHVSNFKEPFGNQKWGLWCEKVEAFTVYTHFSSTKKEATSL